MINKSDIFKQLENLEAPRDKTVLVHTSLRLIGDVEGGGEGLLDALIEYFTAEGGILAIPTHTWAFLGEDRITLDMTKAESNLGALSTIAARDARGLRSENPTHSVVLFGDREKALDLIKNEGKLQTPTAPEGFHAKLYEEGGKILLIGTDQSKNTYLHAVAEMLRLKNRMSDEITTATVKTKRGEIYERKIRLYDEDLYGDISYRFPKYETAFRYFGAISYGFVGKAPAELCDARKMRDAVETIFRRCGESDPLATDEPIPPKWYV